MFFTSQTSRETRCCTRNWVSWINTQYWRQFLKRAQYSFYPFAFAHHLYTCRTFAVHTLTLCTSSSEWNVDSFRFSNEFANNFQQWRQPANRWHAFAPRAMTIEQFCGHFEWAANELETLGKFHRNCGRTAHTVVDCVDVYQLSLLCTEWIRFVVPIEVRQIILWAFKWIGRWPVVAENIAENGERTTNGIGQIAEQRNILIESIRCVQTIWTIAVHIWYNHTSQRWWLRWQQAAPTAHFEMGNFNRNAFSFWPPHFICPFNEQTVERARPQHIFWLKWYTENMVASMIGKYFRVHTHLTLQAEYFTLLCPHYTICQAAFRMADSILN